MRKYKFSVEDIKRLLKQIVILVDSRERKTPTYWNTSRRTVSHTGKKNWNTAIIRS